MSLASYTYDKIRTISGFDQKELQNRIAHETKLYTPHACHIGEIVQQCITGYPYLSDLDAYEAKFKMAPKGANAFYLNTRVKLLPFQGFFNSLAKIFNEDAFPSYKTVSLDAPQLLKADLVERSGLLYLLPQTNVLAVPARDPAKMVVITDDPFQMNGPKAMLELDKPLFDALYREPQKPTTTPHQPGAVATAENV